MLQQQVVELLTLHETKFNSCFEVTTMFVVNHKANLADAIVFVLKFRQQLVKQFPAFRSQSSATNLVSWECGMIDEQTVKYILEALGVVAGALVIRWLNKKYQLTAKAKDFLAKLNPFKKKEVESEGSKNEGENK